MDVLPNDVLQEIILFAIEDTFHEKNPDITRLLLISKKFRKIISSLSEKQWIQCISYLKEEPFTPFNNWKINFIQERRFCYSERKIHYHPKRKMSNALDHYLMTWQPAKLKLFPYYINFQEITIEDLNKQLKSCISDEEKLQKWKVLLSEDGGTLEPSLLPILLDFEKCICESEKSFVRIIGEWFSKMNKNGGGREQESPSFHKDDMRLDVLRNGFLAFYPTLKDSKGKIHFPNQEGIFDNLKEGEEYKLIEQSETEIVNYFPHGFSKISKRPLVGPARYHMRVFTNPHTLTKDEEFKTWESKFPHPMEEVRCEFLHVTEIYPSVKKISCVSFIKNLQIHYEHIRYSSMMGNSEVYSVYSSNRGLDSIGTHFPNIEVLHLKYPRIIWADGSPIRREYCPLETDCLGEYLGIQSIMQASLKIESLKALIIDYPVVKNDSYPVILRIFFVKQ